MHEPVPLAGGIMERTAASFFGRIGEKFALRAAGVIRQPPLDPRMVPPLGSAACLFGADAIYVGLSDLTFPPMLLVQIFGLLVSLLAGGMLARSYGMPRLGDTLQAFSFISIFGALVVVATVILTRHSWPFADAVLSGADHALQLDWLALFGIFQRHPALVLAGRLAYNSFFWQAHLIFPVLFGGRLPKPAWRLINAWVIALILVLVICPFFTALGPYINYGIVPGDIPTLHSKYPWTTGPLIEAIRTHRSTDVAGSMGGLVFFPSFHSAGAILFIWAWWPVRQLRWPMLLLNLAMLAAVPVIGYHYFSDMIGGIVVALAAIFLANKLVSRIERSTTAAPG